MIAQIALQRHLVTSQSSRQLLYELFQTFRQRCHGNFEFTWQAFGSFLRMVPTAS